MDKEKKNRSGSVSNGSPKKAGNDRGKSAQPGAPNKSNRQTGGSDRHERDDSSRGADRNTTKKGSNAV